MPRQLSAIICILFIFYLFWVDRNKSDIVSKAVWIPQIWMFIAGSRFVSQWLNLGAPKVADIYLEGNPVDRIVFLILILAGTIILVQRRPNWSDLITKNAWIWLFFIFGAISILWSDFPFVSFKRWIKALGNVIMALVILTEERPYEAIGVILRRLTFLLIPLSVLFIKYYPDLGRAYHWDGTQMFTGVTSQKNSLGQICLISGTYFCWSLLLYQREWIALRQRLHLSACLILISMIVWLFYKANSATSFVCMAVAIGLFLFSRKFRVDSKPRRILHFGIACILLFGLLELTFDVTAAVITMLGRDSTLTTRVPMWNQLLSMVKNPIFGFGYESFWLGDRQQIIRKTWGIAFNAHNGYLEMYLNLGLIGVSFMLIWILSGLRKVARHLEIDYPSAMLRLCLIVVIALYNWTEATFYGVSNMWVLFLFAVIEISNQQHRAEPIAAAGAKNKAEP